jgi:two-component system NtrC family sensor kinase
VRALQGFADESSDGIRDFDLLEGLESTLGVVAGSLTGRIELVRELSPMPPIRCVPSAINHVFMNLLLNAAAAIPARGVITVRSGSSDDEVWVEVADSGCGIRAEHLPRVFEPFFTTQPIGHGMGLGLTTAWDTVVNKHAGQIDVRSTPDAGSSFTVRLPRRLPAPVALQETRTAALP